MEKLQPQTPKSQLVTDAQSQYAIAQNYYAQRRKMFKNFLEQNGRSASSIESQINNSIEKIWNEKIFNVMQGIYWGGQKNGTSVADMQKQIAARFDLPPEIMNKLYQAVTYGNPQNFYSALGFAFEEWLEKEGVGPIISQGQEFAEQHAEALLNTFVSGGLQSKASIVSGSRNIRSDLLITTYMKTDFKQDSKGVLRSPEGLPMELQSTMNIDWSQAVPEANEIMSDYSILQDFLQAGKGNVFGLSAKSWSASDGKEFMKSSVLQQMLNATFNKKDSDGRRHSWQPDYTMEYVAYFLSHRILDIIGPTTIALVSRKGITWMDDFLSAHIFYMQVQLERYWKKRDGGLGRMYPQITNPGVYVRNHSIGTATAFKAKEHTTKKHGHYIDLKVT